MSIFIHQPNDKLFKKAMADIRVARQFFEVHLPALILERVDLKTLKLEKQSFIDEAYKGSEADVVYSVKIAESTGYFYLLCENQSEVDYYMAFRLLSYTVRLMETHLKQYRKQSLPIIYPLVLYTGKKIWDAPRDIIDLFGDHKELAKQILFKSYNLIEVQKEKDEDLRRHLWSGMVEFALKHRNTRNFSQLLEILFHWMNDIVIEKGENFARVVLKYVIDGIEEGNEKLLIEKANEILSYELRGDVMTIAEQIERRGIERGMEQGMKQGVKQGMKQGMKQGESALFIRFLERKFGEIPARYLNYIQQADSEVLLKWIEKIVRAKTLREVFQK